MALGLEFLMEKGFDGCCWLLVALALLLVFLFPEEAFLELLALEDFTGFETLIPLFVDFTDCDPFPDFVPGPLFPELVRPTELFLVFETLTKFLFLSLFSVIWFLTTSFRTLSLLISSKLSFFLNASSILVANIKSFLATKLVTFPAAERGSFFLIQLHICKSQLHNQYTIES